MKVDGGGQRSNQARETIGSTARARSDLTASPDVRGHSVGPEREDLVIFISHRRSDAADAGRLYDALRRRFGRNQLFEDVDNLLPGEDFVEAINHAVAHGRPARADRSRLDLRPVPA